MIRRSAAATASIRRSTLGSQKKTHPYLRLSVYMSSVPSQNIKTVSDVAPVPFNSKHSTTSIDITQQQLHNIDLRHSMDKHARTRVVEAVNAVTEPSLHLEKEKKYTATLEDQLRIEDEQLVEASRLYSENFNNLAKIGKGTTMKSAQKLLLEWYEPLVAALNKEFDEIAAGLPATDRNQYAQYLVQLPVEKLAVITLSTTLNCMMRSGNLGEKLCKISMEIANMVEAESRMLQIKQDRTASAWAKRIAKQQQPASNRHLAKFNRRLADACEDEEWSPPTKAKVGAVLIHLLVNSAHHDGDKPSFIYTNNFHQSGGTGYAKRMGFIRMDPVKYLDFTHLSVKEITLLMPRYMPMLVHPQSWNSRDYAGAYYRMKAPIMKATSSLQTLAVRSSSMKPVLESLDYLGKIGWRINPLVHRVIETCVNEKITIADLPSQVNLPLPDEESCYRPVRDILSELEASMSRFSDRMKDAPTGNSDDIAAAADLASLHGNSSMTPAQHFAQRVQDLRAANPDELRLDERYLKYMTQRVHRKNGELHSLRCDVKIKLSIAGKFKDSVMYFPHNIDFRGRAYPVPPNLSHLGNDFCRGIMMFDKAKPLGPKGLRWLKIHLANLCGHNKVSLDERVQWADAHMAEIRDSVARPLEGNRWWASAESPFQALAACAEIVAAVDSGNHEAYECRLPVHQDGSCNGLQHYAGLGRDAQGGAAVNLVPHATPQDVYSSVLKKVQQKVEDDAAAPDNDPRAKDGRRDRARMVQGFVTRKVIKQTVMTSVYGVTYAGARAQVEARLHEVFNLDSATTTPEREKEVNQAAMYLAGLTLSSLSEMFQSARSIMDWLGDCAKLVAGQNHSVSWITPLGLPVIQPYRKLQLHTVNTVMQTISLASSSDLLPISTKKQKTAFPPNFVHSMDATHMMMTSLKMKGLGLNFAAVHDSYWTHPCDIETMGDCLRDAFVELYSQPLLEDLRESMVMRFPEIEFPPVPERGSLDINLVKQSSYFFH